MSQIERLPQAVPCLLDGPLSRAEATAYPQKRFEAQAHQPFNANFDMLDDIPMSLT